VRNVANHRRHVDDRVALEDAQPEVVEEEELHGSLLYALLAWEYISLARKEKSRIAVESWYVMMGIGQVVTLRVPPARLRQVNRAVEQTAWKAFRAEFYPTYDLREVVKTLREQALKGK